MDRRTFLAAGSAALGWPAIVPGESNTVGELLPNGIRLPAVWPPQLKELPETPATPPYLVAPPAVIPIDLGRQLFVDDFLIEKTTLTRSSHKPKPHPANPILRPDQLWERGSNKPMAMTFSDGVWYDPQDKRFKMWYRAGAYGMTCLALSDDGIRWTKPDLGVKPGTNVVHPGPRDAASVLLDAEETDPARRFKLFRANSENKSFGLSVHFSPDGIHWAERAFRTGPTGDRVSVFYNPFRKVWVYSLRHQWLPPRARRYHETADLLKNHAWPKVESPVLWVGTDKLDPPRDDLKVPPQLYNLDCVAYESLILGLFSIWRGDANLPPGRSKPNEVQVGYSRDGFHWHRPERTAFIGPSEKPGDWNWGNVQSAGGCCLVVGDELYFYHSGRAGNPGGPEKWDYPCATGLSTLRRDGFVSLDAGDAGGTLTTRPVQFTGKHLFVNAALTGNAELTAEVLGENGQPLPGFTRADGVPARGDRTKQAVTWKAAELAAVAGKAVRFRFHLTGGQFYAFWVSREATGASGGYVAGGGPGLTHRDGGS